MRLMKITLDDAIGHISNAPISNHARHDKLADRLNKIFRESGAQQVSWLRVTYRDMENSGKLALIEDATLRFALSDYYEHSAQRSRRISARITGMDYGAPRRLVLWRVDRDRAAPLARAASAPGGAFDFGHILVPPRGLRLVATAEGAAPEAWQRDAATALDAD